MNSIGSLINERTGEIVAQRLLVADTFFSRLLGLQFRRRLPKGAGLLLIPCRSVHTFCMRFTVDVIFLSDSGRVLKVVKELRPWRIAVCRDKAHAALELASGTASVRLGDQLRMRFTDTAGVDETKSLRLHSDRQSAGAAG